MTTQLTKLTDQEQIEDDASAIKNLEGILSQLCYEREQNNIHIFEIKVMIKGLILRRDKLKRKLEKKK